MQAAVDTFEERSDKMEATDLELNPLQTEAAVLQQELLKKEINFDNIKSLEDIQKMMFGCAVSPMGEEADPRQSWVLTEVVCLPETTDTRHHPCNVQGTCP
jgi:hypothetical protein